MGTESILQSVKKQLGITPDYTHFDADIITGINSAFMILNQLGVGPDDPFTITGADEVWTDFIEDGKIELVKSYIPLRVKLLFDPPTNSFLVENINRQIAEFESRMNIEAEKDLLYPSDMTGIFME